MILQVDGCVGLDTFRLLMFILVLLFGKKGDSHTCVEWQKLCLWIVMFTFNVMVPSFGNGDNSVIFRLLSAIEVRGLR